MNRIYADEDEKASHAGVIFRKVPDFRAKVPSYLGASCESAVGFIL
jgi:hypothetical protein